SQQKQLDAIIVEPQLVILIDASLRREGPKAVAPQRLTGKSFTFPRAKAKSLKTSNSPPPPTITTSALTSRTRPLSIFPSKQASPWKPTIPTGNPTTSPSCVYGHRFSLPS